MTDKPAINAPFDRSKGAATVRGIAWQLDEERAEWIRHVMRAYSDGTAYWSRTIWVDASQPYCLHCLSPNVVIIEDTPAEQIIFCRDCVAGTYRLLKDSGDAG